MRSLDDTIQLLKEIIFDENCDRMNKSVVKGYLGELITIQKLQHEGFKPEHKGKLSGVDIIVDGIKIDVKTSVLKDDGFEIWNWGWALSKKGKPVKYHVAVCVALDDKLNNFGFYCINGRNEPDFRSPHKQFTSVTGSFQKFPIAPTENSSMEFIEAYERSEELIKNGKVIQISPNESLGANLHHLYDDFY